jgi:hypothetical protein
MFLALLTIYHRDFSPQKRGVPAVPGVPSAAQHPAEQP